MALTLVRRVDQPNESLPLDRQWTARESQVNCRQGVSWTLERPRCLLGFDLLCAWGSRLLAQRPA